MTKFGTKLSELSTFIKDRQVTFTNGFLAIATLVGELAFRSVAFQPPCDPAEAAPYAWSFLCGPAFVLWMLAILANTVTWRLCHGCCHRSCVAKHDFLESVGRCISILVRSAVAPAAWIFVALLDGDFYVCIRSTEPCAEKSEQNRNLNAASQFIAWMFLIVVVFVVSAAVLITRCADRLTYKHAAYASIYRSVEKRRFEEIMQKNAEALANANVSKFLNQGGLFRKDWDLISMVPVNADYSKVHEKGESQLEADKSEPCYTPLHRWVKERYGDIEAAAPLLTEPDHAGDTN